MTDNRSGARQWFAFALLAVTCALSTAACDNLRRNDTAHPLPGRVPGEQGANAVGRGLAPQGSDSTARRGWHKARRALIDTRLLATVGSLSTEAPDLFGSIADVVVDTARDQMFVLDAQAQQVRIFNMRGDFVDAFGGLGDGPSELRLANSIELIGGNRILVGSRNLKAKVFAETPDGWRVERIVPLPSGARGLCIGPDERVFVNAHDRNTNLLVQELDLFAGIEMSPAHRFVGGYKDDNWLVQRQLGTGFLACPSKPRPLVVFGHANIPLLRAFDPDSGELVWASRLTHFTATPLYSGTDSRGDYTYHDQPEEWDVLGAVHRVGESHLLVQVGHGDRTRQTLTVDSYLIDAETGRGAFISDKLPRLVPYENGYVGIYDEPYPRLELREFRETT